MPRSLPQILSGSEVAALFEALRSLTYRTVVMTLYGSGLRISEACALQVGQIDSKRMLLHVRLDEHHFVVRVTVGRVRRAPRGESRLVDLEAVESLGGSIEERSKTSEGSAARCPRGITRNHQ